MNKSQEFLHTIKQTLNEEKMHDDKKHQLDEWLPVAGTLLGTAARVAAPYAVRAGKAAVGAGKTLLSGASMGAGLVGLTAFDRYTGASDKLVKTMDDTFGPGHETSRIKAEEEKFIKQQQQQQQQETPTSTTSTIKQKLNQSHELTATINSILMNERKLHKDEKERLKNKFEETYGKDGKRVMYAVATKKAKEGKTLQQSSYEPEGNYIGEAPVNANVTNDARKQAVNITDKKMPTKRERIGPSYPGDEINDYRVTYGIPESALVNLILKDIDNLDFNSLSESQQITSILNNIKGFEIILPEESSFQDYLDAVLTLENIESLDSVSEDDAATMIKIAETAYEKQDDNILFESLSYSHWKELKAAHEKAGNEIVNVEQGAGGIKGYTLKMKDGTYIHHSITATGRRITNMGTSNS